MARRFLTSLLVLSLVSLALIGCEVSEEDEARWTPTAVPTSSGPTPTPGGSPVPTPTTAGLSISIEPESPTGTVGVPLEIRATLLNNGLPVSDGTPIVFTTNFGSLSAFSVGTVDGVATVNLVSQAQGPARVCADFGARRACTDVSIEL